MLGKEFADFQLDRHQALEAPVVKQQVDKELLRPNRQSKLAGDEGEDTAHLAQEGLDPGQDLRLELPL